MNPIDYILNRSTTMYELYKDTRLKNSQDDALKCFAELDEDLNDLQEDIKFKIENSYDWWYGAESYYDHYFEDIEDKITRYKSSAERLGHAKGYMDAMEHTIKDIQYIKKLNNYHKTGDLTRELRRFRELLFEYYNDAKNDDEYSELGVHSYIENIIYDFDKTCERIKENDSDE